MYASVSARGRHVVALIAALAAPLTALGEEGNIVVCERAIPGGGSSGWSQIRALQPVGQSFTAIRSEIDVVGFLVGDGNKQHAPDDYTLEARLYEGEGVWGPLLATAVGTLPFDDYRGWVDFDFSGTAFEVGQVYTVVVGNDSARWGIRNRQSVTEPADRYPGGSAVSSGTVRSFDQCFRVLSEPLDFDDDGVVDAEDSCEETPNPDQLDTDGDLFGDACDACVEVPDVLHDGGIFRDRNDDGLPDPYQLDADSDGVGDACDTCVHSVDPGQEDDDGDGVGNVCDNCPQTVNPDQADSDAAIESHAFAFSPETEFRDWFSGTTYVEMWECDDTFWGQGVLLTCGACDQADLAAAEPFLWGCPDHWGGFSWPGAEVCALDLTTGQTFDLLVTSFGCFGSCTDLDGGATCAATGDHTSYVRTGLYADGVGDACEGVATECPCDGGWKHHGEYQACVARAAGELRRDGVIDQAEQGAIVAEAAHSDCGR